MLLLPRVHHHNFRLLLFGRFYFIFFHWNFIATGLTNSWFLFMCTKIMSELCKSITLSQFHALWLTNNSMLFIFAPFLHSEPSAEDCRCCSIKWKWFFVHLNGKLFVVLFAAERSNRLSTAKILMSIEGFFDVLQNKMKLMKCNEKIQIYFFNPFLPPTSLTFNFSLSDLNLINLINYRWWISLDIF